MEEREREKQQEDRIKNKRVSDSPKNTFKKAAKLHKIWGGKLTPRLKDMHLQLGFWVLCTFAFSFISHSFLCLGYFCETLFGIFLYRPEHFHHFTPYIWESLLLSLRKRKNMQIVVLLPLWPMPITFKYYTVIIFISPSIVFHCLLNMRCMYFPFHKYLIMLVPFPFFNYWPMRLYVHVRRCTKLRSHFCVLVFPFT